MDGRLDLVLWYGELCTQFIDQAIGARLLALEREEGMEKCQQ